MRHQDLTLNHRLESYVYANATDRNNATGFVPGDIGRIAFQSDTMQYWRRLGADGAPPPLWLLISGSGNLVYERMVTSIQNPAGTNSTTPVMMGLGGVSVFTPTATGTIFLAIQGGIINTGAALDEGSFASGIFASGTPPANGAAEPGGPLAPVPFGTQVRLLGVKSVSLNVPFCMTSIVTGLILGTPYYMDISLSTTAGGFAQVTTVVLSAIELP